MDAQMDLEDILSIQDMQVSQDENGKRVITLEARGYSDVHDISTYAKLSPLTLEEMQGVDPSFACNDGIVIQFINNNSVDAATIIGGVRLEERDIRKIPAYLFKYEDIFRIHAIRYLQRHMIKTQCCAGLGEKLTSDDYSLSFMVANLSDEAMNLHPTGRKEGPLHLCWSPNLIREVPWYRPDGTLGMTRVINAYIHLVESPRRRSALLQKKDEEKKAGPAQPPQKRANNGSYTNQNRQQKQ